ncbi:MAG: hypothetical protein IKS27_03285, partial [Oscillospiraceae bacterium]|nr:hypothetical protein [Oscillospiraceae bacterium]
MNKRRVLSLILAILMVMTLLPTTALAASKGKTANVQASVKIGGKTVKVALEKAPAGTKLKLSEPKKSDYKKAVDKAVSGKYDVVLAVKAGVSPSLKKEVKATITASAINGKKADQLKLFRVADGKAREIKGLSVSGKNLTFSSKS